MWAGLWMCLHQPELPARSPVGVAGGGHLVQAHLAARSLLPCSDEVHQSALPEPQGAAFSLSCLPFSAAHLACAALGLKGSGPGRKGTWRQSDPRGPGCPQRSPATWVCFCGTLHIPVL